MSPKAREGLSRRSFVKAAVAIGGASALSACVDRLGEPDVPQGPSDLASLPARQHAWNGALTTDEHANHVMPRHHVLRYVDLNSEPPTADERETVRTALRDLERAYARQNDGLLFTIGYSSAYFERFEESLSDSVDLPEPRALSALEDPELDRAATVLHLASDHPQVVLAAEEALFGEREAVNGIKMETSLATVFEPVDRRTGFVGEGLPAEHQDVGGIPDSEPVPEESPLYMGFKSGFEKNQASEDRVTIEAGPFAGGTTEQISWIGLNLQQWYEQDSRYQRVGKMFCPTHAEQGTVEGVGKNLKDDAGMDGCPFHAAEDARNNGMVGHAQKAARARENGAPLLLRRDFDSTDGNQAGLHFLSLQRSIDDFVTTREAINGADLVESSAVGQRTNNGIRQYMTVKRRGNFLVPPRRLRALPEANPG